MSIGHECDVLVRATEAVRGNKAITMRALIQQRSLTLSGLNLNSVLVKCQTDNASLNCRTIAYLNSLPL